MTWYPFMEKTCPWPFILNLDTLTVLSNRVMEVKAYAFQNLVLRVHATFALGLKHYFQNFDLISKNSKFSTNTWRGCIKNRFQSLRRAPGFMFPQTSHQIHEWRICKMIPASSYLCYLSLFIILSQDFKQCEEKKNVFNLYLSKH